MSAAKDRVRLWLRLLKVTRQIEDGLRDHLRSSFGTTLPRFDMMSALSRHPEGLKMSQISALLRVSNGNVTGLADKLAEEGLVERVPVPGDRRAMLLRLTPAGLEAFDVQAQAHERWIDDTLKGLSPEEARAMAGHLTRLAEQKEMADAV